MKETELPYILEETGDFAVVYKPPRMHCAPLVKKTDRPLPVNKLDRSPAERKTDRPSLTEPRHNEETLLDWYASFFPPVLSIAGGREGEGGLMHRLDYETRGLVLFAKNQEAFGVFQSGQLFGDFVKEYSALCEKSESSLPGFPPLVSAGFPPLTSAGFAPDELSPDKPFVIESYFRPFGPGRKQVRPVITAGKKIRKPAGDRGNFYRTEIVSVRGDFFTLRIKRGFRHQLRCHLSWIGFPIKNDPLYGTDRSLSPERGFLALCAQALFFHDPRTGQKREFRIAALENFPLSG